MNFGNIIDRQRIKFWNCFFAVDKKRNCILPP